MLFTKSKRYFAGINRKKNLSIQRMTECGLCEVSNHACSSLLFHKYNNLCASWVHLLHLYLCFYYHIYKYVRFLPCVSRVVLFLLLLQQSTAPQKQIKVLNWNLLWIIMTMAQGTESLRAPLHTHIYTVCAHTDNPSHSAHRNNTVIYRDHTLYLCWLFWYI